MNSIIEEKFWEDRDVLITGASGFLGGWLVARLIDYGANIAIINRNSKSECRLLIDNLINTIKVYTADLQDYSKVNQILQEFKPQTIFHMAAVSDVQEAYANPLNNFRTAIDGTLSMLEYCRILSPNCGIVVSSSDKAYGPQDVPYRESQNLNPNSPYEVAKALQDLTTQCYGKMYNLPTVVTRCANYFGGWDFNWHRIIPGTIRSILDNEDVILRSDGKFTRDFLYIEDAVDIQLLLGQEVITNDKIQGEAFNFSLEVNIEVIEIVNKIIEIMNAHSSNLRINESAKAEIRFMQVDSSKARNILSWKPKYTLERGLSETIEWYMKYHKQFLL